MQKTFNDIEKKTITEHISIILNYKKTGFIDREHAIEKYKEFNIKYPDYNLSQISANMITNTFIQFDNATNDVIAGNLYSQLLWLVGSAYLKTLGL